MHRTISQPSKAVRAAMERLKREMPEAFAAVSRHMQLAELLAAKGSVAEVTIDRVTIGEVQAGAMEIAGAAMTLKAGAARLHDVRMVIRLALSLDWKIDLGFLYSDSGSDDLGAFEFALGVGDVTIPGLDQIAATIPSATIPGARFTVPDMGPIRLGAGTFEGLAAKNLTMPASGFSLDGMNVGGLHFDGMELPEASCAEARIERVRTAEPAVLPSVSVDGVALPSVKVPDIASGALDVRAIAASRAIGVDLGALQLTLRVVPSVRMQVAGMVMHDAEVGATVGKLTLSGVRIPVSVQGIGLARLDLQSVSMSDLSM